MDEILTSHLGYEILQESLSLPLLSSLLSSLLRLLVIMLVSSVLGDPASVLELALAILSAKQPVEEGGR